LLRFLGSSRLDKGCAQNDLVIIQIDTDCSGEFGVPLSNNLDETIFNVAKKLIQTIGFRRFIQYRHQIVFAISVNSLECWVLPFYETSNDAVAAKVDGCVNKLNEYLLRNYRVTIAKGGNKSKSIAYKAITADRPRFKPAAIQTHTPRNPSLHIFWQVLVGKIEACVGPAGA